MDQALMALQLFAGRMPTVGKSLWYNIKELFPHLKLK